MMRMPHHAVLLIIDVQQGFDEPHWGQRNNLDAEQQIERLLTMWRHTQRPVIHVQHLSRSPDSPLRADRAGSAIKPALQPHPDELLITKHVNSAFIGTNLEQHLRQHSYDTLVIVGLTTPHCVSTTTRMAGNLGFTTYLVADATAAFALVGPDGQHHTAESIHAVALATLHGEFATVVDTATVLNMLAQE